MSDREYYKFVADEDELKWFFDHVVAPPEINETYMMCVSARNKKLDEKERLIYQLGRGEMMREEMVRPRSKSHLWDFNVFKSAVYKYECNVHGMVTKNGMPYPQKCLVIYFYPNPSKESLVVSDTMKLAVTMMTELINAAEKRNWSGVEDGLGKLGTVAGHMKSSHATNIGRKLYVQYDFDLPSDAKLDEVKIGEAFNVLHSEGLKHFGRGNFFIVRTSGGFHVLVKKEGAQASGKMANKRRKAEKLGFLPDYVYDVTEKISYKFEEAIKCKQDFIPLPGTYQYGNFKVSILNKGDFDTCEYF